MLQHLKCILHFELIYLFTSLSLYLILRTPSFPQHSIEVHHHNGFLFALSKGTKVDYQKCSGLEKPSISTSSLAVKSGEPERLRDQITKPQGFHSLAH